MQMLKRINKKEFITTYINYGILFLLFTYLFMLDMSRIIFIMLFLFCTIPFHLYCETIYEKEKNRFEELTTYLNYVVINYKISGKIRKSLIDTRSVFSKHSTMYRCINETIKKIDEGVSLEESLETIETCYYNSYITQIHRYMIMGEVSVGTAVYTALSQVNVKSWKANVELLQHEKQKIRKHNFRYAIIALTTAYLPLPFLSDFLDVIKSDPTYQFATTVFFFLFICVFALIPFVLISKWIDEKE